MLSSEFGTRVCALARRLGQLAAAALCIVAYHLKNDAPESLWGDALACARGLLHEDGVSLQSEVWAIGVVALYMAHDLTLAADHRLFSHCERVLRKAGRADYNALHQCVMCACTMVSCLMLHGSEPSILPCRNMLGTLRKVSSGAFDESMPRLLQAHVVVALRCLVKRDVFHQVLRDAVIVITLRRVVGVPEDDPLWYPKSSPSFTRDMFLLHTC